jgi:hypothetical protein
MSGAPCSVRTADFRGWSAAYLENGIIRLAAVPDIGGRLMAYDLGPYPYLFVDPDLAGKLFTAEENLGDGSLAAWKNYGGDKTWPSPQGWDNDQQWHGPPDPVLDTGRYKLDTLEGSGEKALVRMVSPADVKTGVQISRQFTIRQGSSRVTLDLAFTNILEKKIRWSIWDVVQLRAEYRTPGGKMAFDPNCYVTAPLNPQSRFPRGFNTMFGKEDNPQWQIDERYSLFKGQYLWEIGKVGIDSPDGWIAFSQGSEGYAFTERFTYEEDGDYPDDGVTVECWTVGAGQVANLDYGATEIYLMETEVLSPLRTIAPGATETFSIEWGACRCPGPVIDVNEVGCVAEPLQADVKNDFVHLTGKFGVFDVGKLSLIWRSERGQMIKHESLGEFDPLTAVLLDRVVPIPIGSKSVHLQGASMSVNNPILATVSLE